MQQRAAKSSASKLDKAIEAYVKFSTALLLRMNIEPPSDGHEDPELDVEAQFGQRARQGAQQSTVNNKCLSGWCWCKSSDYIALFSYPCPHRPKDVLPWRCVAMKTK